MSCRIGPSNLNLEINKINRVRPSSGDGANGGGRAPTTVRLPVGHGGRHASSPELLVDGEEKKSGSTAASPRRGGATVADGGPATVRRERKVNSSSTGEERRGEALGRRSLDEARDGEGDNNGEGSARTAGCGTFGQGRADTAGRGGGAREAAVGRSGRAALSEAARSAGCGRDARSRQCLKPRCQRGTWRPRGSGALPRGPGTARDG
jgi:hypothetical protein